MDRTKTILRLTVAIRVDARLHLLHCGVWHVLVGSIAQSHVPLSVPKHWSQSCKLTPTVPKLWTPSRKFSMSALPPQAMSPASYPCKHSYVLIRQGSQYGMGLSTPALDLGYIEILIEAVSVADVSVAVVAEVVSSR